MSLFSKLFGGKRSSRPDAAEPWNRTQRSAFGADEDETPIGRSWGERMPNEPNQYNYPGSYRDYFEDIFSREFEDYRVRRSENPRTDRAVAYTFFDGARTALVVELLSRRTDTQVLRRSCERSGIPYLRFYYDYHGWWNARSYVVNRIQDALRR